MKDRLLRSLKIRDRDCSIFSSDRFEDADFRIAVSKDGMEHFVFADIVLLKWMRDLLQRALEKSWKLDKGLVRKSGSRALHLSSFKLKEVLFLRVMEICGNGQRFFVSIPSDDAQVGWKSWLKTVESVLLEVGAAGRGSNFLTKGAKQHTRSFAEVVGGSVISDEIVLRPQRGLVEESLEVPELVFEEDGVDSRVSRLKSWVVVKFMLGYNDFIAWEDFQLWLKRWWRVELGWGKQRLGDDAWLIECESEKMVQSVVQRKYWFFKGARMEVKPWSKEDGQSDLPSRNGMKWILVFGCPVHLRSEALFRKLGDLCGGFVDVQETGFSANRIKVKDGFRVPNAIDIRWKGALSQVKILEEPTFEFHKHESSRPRVTPSGPESVPSSDREVEEVRGEAAVSNKEEEGARVEEVLSLPFGPVIGLGEGDLIESILGKPWEEEGNLGLEPIDLFKWEGQALLGFKEKGLEFKGWAV
ncbi:hypothetical protein LINPERPRIM_LOCUS2113 [Linum perenne]